VSIGNISPKALREKNRLHMKKIVYYHSTLLLINETDFTSNIKCLHSRIQSLGAFYHLALSLENYMIQSMTGFVKQLFITNQENNSRNKILKQ
jgi:hypothetical protein